MLAEIGPGSEEPFPRGIDSMTPGGEANELRVYVEVDGVQTSLATPRVAHEQGIRVIYQEPEIASTVSVAENLFMGELPTRFGRFVDRRRLDREVQEILQRSGFGEDIDPRMPADRLTPAQRQLVEILKALKGGVRALALDEPTSSLTEAEVDRLVAIVRRFRSNGVGISLVGLFEDFLKGHFRNPAVVSVVYLVARSLGIVANRR